METALQAQQDHRSRGGWLALPPPGETAGIWRATQLLPLSAGSGGGVEVANTHHTDYISHIQTTMKINCKNWLSLNDPSLGKDEDGAFELSSDSSDSVSSLETSSSNGKSVSTVEKPVPSITDETTKVLNQMAGNDDSETKASGDEQEQPKQRW